MKLWFLEGWWCGDCGESPLLAIVDESHLEEATRYAEAFDLDPPRECEVFNRIPEYDKLPDGLSYYSYEYGKGFVDVNRYLDLDGKRLGESYDFRHVNYRKRAQLYAHSRDEARAIVRKLSAAVKQRKIPSHGGAIPACCRKEKPQETKNADHE